MAIARTKEPDPIGEPAPAGLADAARAFEQDWGDRSEFLRNSPITAFLKAHEIAGTPNELTITGVADVKVTLGDLRAFARTLE
jgi:hypothetical protein